MALPTKCDRSQNVGWAVPTNSPANVVGKAHPTCWWAKLGQVTNLPRVPTQPAQSLSGGQLALALEIEGTLHRVGLIAEVLRVPAIRALLDLAAGEVRQTFVLLGQSALDCDLLFDFVRHDVRFNLGAKKSHSTWQTQDTACPPSLSGAGSVAKVLPSNIPAERNLPGSQDRRVFAFGSFLRIGSSDSVRENH